MPDEQRDNRARDIRERIEDKFGIPLPGGRRGASDIRGGRQQRAAEIRARAKQALEEPLAPPPETLSLGETLSAAGQGAAGVLDFIGALGVNENAAARNLGGQVGAADLVRSESRRLGVDPEAGRGTFARNLAEEAGASGPLLPLTGGVGAARRPVLRGLSEVGSVLGAAGGRTGAESPDVEAAGGLAGGVLGGSVPGLVIRGKRALQSAGSFLGGLVTGKITPTRAQRLASEIFQESASDVPRALRELEHVEDLRQSTPGFDPTLGAATSDPGLMTLEADVFRHRSTGGPTLLDTQLARSKGNEALRRELIELRPNRGTVDEARAAVRSHVDSRMNAVLTDLEKVRGSSSPAELSELARSEFDKLENEFQTTIGQVFDDVADEAAARRVVTRLRPVNDALKEIRRDIGRFGTLEIPRDIVRQLDQLAEEGEKYVSFGDLRSLEKRINAELPAARQAKNRQLVRQYGMLKKGVNDALDDFGLIGKPDATASEQRRAEEIIQANRGLLNDDLAADYRNAKAAFAEGATRFREGVGGKLGETRKGRLAVAEQETLDKFFVSGSKGASTADDFLRVFPDGSPARAAMEDFIVARAAEGLMDREGVIQETAANSAKLRKFVSRYAEALRKFPQAMERVRTLRNVVEGAESLGILGRETSREAVQRGALKLFVDDPTKAVRDVLKLTPEEQVRAVDAMMSVVRGTPEASVGLQRAFWNELESRVVRTDSALPGRFTDLRVDPTLLREELHRHRAAFTRLFSAAHLRNVDSLLEKTQILDDIPTGTSESVLKDPESFVPALAGSGIFNTLLGKTARAGRLVRFVDRLDRAAGTPQINRILREAMMNPRLARALLMRPTRENEGRVIQILSANLPSLPFRVDESVPVEEPEPEPPRIATDPNHSGVIGS